MKKRTLFSLFAAVFLLFSLICPVFGSETEPSAPTEPTAISPEEQLETALIAACRYGETLDISAYDVTVEELETLFYRLYYAGRFPWYVTTGFSFEYRQWGDRKQAISFTPTLLDGAFDRLLYEQQVAQLLQSCNLEGLQDWQKALVLHDRLILRCRYDETLQKETGYDLLINGSTVCAGYAALYQDLLQRVGIPSVVVESEEMNHAWNLVQLDGSWYHVDVTWDDPVPDLEGRVQHTHFLRTDEEIRSGEKPHYGWETDISCADDRYSDAFWTELSTQVIFTDKNTCYYGKLKENRLTVYKRTVSKESEKSIYKEDNDFWDVGEGRRRYHHVGLFLENDRLWVCTNEKVISMKTDGKSKKTVFSYDVKKNGKYIAGFRVSAEMLLVQLMDLSETSTYLEEPLTPPKDAHSHSYTLTEVPSTCAAEGYTLAVCDCGIEAKANFVKPLEHSWVEHSSKKATFDEAGYTHRECTVCGYTEYLELPPLQTGSWLRTHWHYVALALMGLLLLINLIALLTSFKKR